MAISYLTVGVVVERRESDSPWIDHAFKPVAVLPDAPDVPPWTSLGKDGRTERFYAGPATLSLFSSDTGQLIENFVSGHGQLWVSIRPTGMDPPVEVVGVTADPSEGEGYLEGMGDVVEPVPMPQHISDHVLAFYKVHHVERPFIKRQRDKARTDVFGVRPGGRPQGGQGGSS
ncbi:MAG: DUF3305 domain-containing protein [Hyphomicrobiales bacterium]|nr:DUF3305 domain-containing protein [Hyphomicrobiales bacterium]